MKVVVDENLPPRLARGLHQLFQPRHEVHAMRELFGAGVTDQEWIEKLGQDGTWVVLSGDRRITRNRAEANAFRQSKLVGFFLAAGLCKSPLHRQASRITFLWEDIITLAGHVGGGSMFEIPIKSKIRSLKV